MLGKLTAQLKPRRLRWVYRIWGCPNIHTRQKWSAVWPYLAKLPDRLSILDAGCGDGSWALEIAARRPHWTVTGVDRDSNAIARARADAECLKLNRVSFATEDFLQFKPRRAFDVVLSIGSAHYLVESGRGEELFNCFRQWLSEDGILVLLGPRRREEVPLTNRLPALPSHDVFRRSDLENLCRSSALSCESIQPLIGTWGTVAKQLASPNRSLLGRATAYPLELLFDGMDRLWTKQRRMSAAWLLVARRAVKNKMARCS
jgi:SAM-dependent methyltransferase